MDISALETWLWDAACVIRGPVDAPKYKDYILPLIFLKRLSDVFEDELAGVAPSEKFAQSDRTAQRFCVPEQARWETIRQKTTGLGEVLTGAVCAVARKNPKLQGVIDTKDFSETAAGQRIVSDDQLGRLIQVLSTHRLGLEDVQPDILGRAYEYLLRKFAEGQGRSAGKFYTPPEVAHLMAHILDPQPGDEIYDPACGSAGLLIKCHLRFREKFAANAGLIPLRFYGQEINPTTFAMSRINMFIHGMTADIVLGDTMARPAFLTPDGRVRQFDKVTANPMWNQNFARTLYEHDTHGRFTFGVPPMTSADWGWVQAMFASLKDGGKMAVVLDTGAMTRGSGIGSLNREREIRKQFVERDWIEAVVLMADNLFYNTHAPGVILVVSKKKRHKGQVLLLNGSLQCAKGRPKNYLTDQNITTLGDTYLEWRQTEKLSAIVTTEKVIRNDYNLSPSRYVAVNGTKEVLPLEQAAALLAEAEEKCESATAHLNKLLAALGVGDVTA